MNAERVLLVLAALPAALVAAVRRPSPVAAPAEAPVVEAAPAPPPGAAVRAWRGGLIALGVLLIAVAGWALTIGVPVGQWKGIVLWLALALVLHDGLLGPLLIVGARLLRRGHAVLPWGALAALQAVVAVGFVLTLIAFPGIRAQAIGTSNPTVLVWDYSLHLAVAWAVAGALAAAAIIAGRVVRARRTASVHS